MAEGGDRRAWRRAARSPGAGRRRPPPRRCRRAPRRSASRGSRCRRRAPCGRARATSETPITRWPGFGSMHAADVVERDRVVAGDAGDHGVGVAQRHHAGGEMVAVLVDQALAVAEQDSPRAAAARRGSRHRPRCGATAARCGSRCRRGHRDRCRRASAVAAMIGPRGRPGSAVPSPLVDEGRWRRGSPAPPRPRRRRRAWDSGARAR